MANVGLYFGSFNPIHIGHMAIANYIVEYSDIDELWFVISPHNPFKKKASLLNDQFRLDMVQAAIEGDARFRTCDVEFRMPQPSFTIDTLAYLQEKHPAKKLSIIMGSDGLPSFHKWKNADLIIEKHKRYVYPRHTEDIEEIKKHKNVEIVDAPRIEVSSSFVRQAIQQKKDVRYFLPPKVFEIIDSKGFYS